jgi:DNA primase
MNEILDVIQAYGLDILREGSVLRAYCPFHNDTNKPNFTIYLETNSWFCFACSEGGDVIAFVAKIENITRDDAKRKLLEDDTDLENLKEQLESVTDDTLVFNDEVNIIVSKHIRKMLNARPESAPGIFSYLKTLDGQLLLPVNQQKMEEILKNLKQISTEHE